MGDGGGHLAHGHHARDVRQLGLRYGQGLLRPLSLGDVLYDPEDELRDPFRAGDQRAADVHPDRLAVLPAVPLHKLERRALARDELRDEVDIVFAIVFVGHHPE